MSLYSISDKISKNKSIIENDLINQNRDLFSSQTNILLNDLTNKYFKDSPQTQKTKPGNSEENSSDCNLESMAAFIDANGYLRKREFFSSNLSEDSTFKSLITQINKDKSSILIMGRGIATDDNILWTHMNGYKYIVISREQLRWFNPTGAVKRITQPGNKAYFYYDNIISFYKEKINTLINNTSIKEIRLNCYSLFRQAKEVKIYAKRIKKYKYYLNKLVNKIINSRKPVYEEDVIKEIARLDTCHQVSEHFKISIVKSGGHKIGTESLVTNLIYEFNPVPNSVITHPGVFSIRTNILNLSGQKIWETYMKWTKVKRLFRPLKSGLGLRPIDHLKDDQIDGHLLISILAYQCINWIRNCLSLYNINNNWESIVDEMSSHHLLRVCHTTSKGTSKGYTERYLAVDLKPKRKQIFDAIGFDYSKEWSLNSARLKDW
jgi:hypothetical protein